jgi:hypothetical protein
MQCIILVESSRPDLDDVAICVTLLYRRVSLVYLLFYILYFI